MALGLSFGKNKQKVNSTTTTNQLQSQTQAGTTSEAKTEAQSSFTQGLTDTISQGSTAGQQATATQQATAGREAQTGRTSLFSDAVLASLQESALGSLDGVRGQNPINVGGVQNFDSEQFITDAVTRATAASGVVRDTSTNSLFDSIGGTAKGNTMAALLDQQLAMQQEGSVAGARNEAAATAAGIQRSNIQAELGVQGQEQGLMNSLLSLLRGGEQLTEAESAQEGSQAGGSTSTSAEQQSQASSQATAQSTQAISSLVSLIAQLVSGTTQTTGTENTKGTTTKQGGGASLSI